MARYIQEHHTDPEWQAAAQDARQKLQKLLEQTWGLPELGRALLDSERQLSEASEQLREFLGQMVRTEREAGVRAAAVQQLEACEGWLGCSRHLIRLCRGSGTSSGNSGGSAAAAAAAVGEAEEAAAAEIEASRQSGSQADVSGLGYHQMWGRGAAIDQGGGLCGRLECLRGGLAAARLPGASGRAVQVFGGVKAGAGAKPWAVEGNEGVAGGR